MNWYWIVGYAASALFLLAIGFCVAVVCAEAAIRNALGRFLGW